MQDRTHWRREAQGSEPSLVLAGGAHAEAPTNRRAHPTRKRLDHATASGGGRMQPRADQRRARRSDSARANTGSVDSLMGEYRAVPRGSGLSGYEVDPCTLRRLSRSHHNTRIIVSAPACALGASLDSSLGAITVTGQLGRGTRGAVGLIVNMTALGGTEGSLGRWLDEAILWGDGSVWEYVGPTWQPFTSWPSASPTGGPTIGARLPFSLEEFQRLQSVASQLSVERRKSEGHVPSHTPPPALAAQPGLVSEPLSSRREQAYGDRLPFWASSQADIDALARQQEEHMLQMKKQREQPQRAEEIVDSDEYSGLKAHLPWFQGGMA